MRALKVTIDNPNARRAEERIFARSPIRIGRTHLNDLVLDSAYVSQYHSVLSFDDGAVEYIDLGSTNGSLLDGVAVKPFIAMTIERGSSIAIGPLRLTPVHTEDKAPRGHPTAAAALAPDAVGATEIGAGAINDLRQAQAAIDALRPAYQAYRTAREKLHEQLHAALTQVISPVRSLVIPSLREAFPEIINDPEFRSLASELGFSNSQGTDTAQLLKIAESLGLGTDAVDTTHGGQPFLKNIALVLEAFAASFVELKNGLEQFSDQVAVNTFSRQTGLHTAHDGPQVLAYLLTNEEDGDNRVDELKGAFADIMIHQVALIAGITEGVRSLLKRLEPSSIAEDLAHEPEKIGALRVRKGFWPLSVVALWRRFQRLHAEMVEEDRGVSAVLFGREFAHSYGAAKKRHHGSQDDPPRGQRHRSTVVVTKQKGAR